MSKLLEPEPDATVKPRRGEEVPRVADIEVAFPYSGDDVCKKCGNPLSRYNPHVLCYKCVDVVRNEAWHSGNKKLLALVDERRRRNRDCRQPSKHINVVLLSQAGGPGPKAGGHRPQNGHL